jgi:hypothetical protein
VALFQALGGHEQDGTVIGSRPSQVARLDTTGVPLGDQAISTIVGTDMALIVRTEHIPNRVDGAGTGAVAHLQAVHAERCIGFRLRVAGADPAAENNAPTR